MTDNGSLLDWLSSLGISKELNNLDILSGTTVNATLTKIVPNYTVRLPPSNTASTRINNWNTVINQLEKVGIKVAQQEKSKILNGDDKVVYGILYELKSLQQKSREEVEVDINKIDARSDPKTSKSLLELFILVIIKHYSFSVKEAVALLSNDSKYLAHILAKGFKDNPKPVQNMLNDLMSLIPQISTFCKNKENQTFFLKSIKPALISKFPSIMEISLELLTEFSKDLPDKVEIVKNQLMSTFVLSQRRHPSQIRPVINSQLQILGFNKNIVSFILAHTQPNEASLMLLELINAGEESNQLQQVFAMFKFQQFVQRSIDNLKSSDLFANSASFLLRTIEAIYPELMQSNEQLMKIVQNLSSLTLSKRGDVLIFTNLTFAFLHIFGRKKNQIAPQFFKLAVDKYRSNLNEDESQNFLLNFLNIIQTFPSIPSVSIVEAILFRYETSTCAIGELQLRIIESSMQQIDEKGALRVYNIITKVFVEEVGSVESISNILETIITKHDSKIIFDLNVKFVKICLAIYYANIRKLNYSKSLVEGVIKLDGSNAFHKAKNNEIQKLLASIITIKDEPLNQAVEPLICYTFIQSEMKNKEEAEGLKIVMILLGDQQELRKLYQADARLLLDEVRNEGKKKDIRIKDEGKIRVSSDVSLLNKKKDFLLHHPPKVPVDAQKGLQKYTKAFKQKMVKISLQEEKKIQDQERLQELRKKFTLKILEKGIRIAKDVEVDCIYEYGTKQREQQRDLAIDFSYLPFYEPEREEERDVKAVQYFTKKYNKLFKVYYNNYGGKLRPNAIKLFDDISLSANLMQSANVWKMLRDNDLDLFITVKEVQHTVQRINANLKKQYKDSSLLDFQVFQNFLIQAALIMFSRPPKDMRARPVSDMLQEIVNKLRHHAHTNKIDEKLFDELDNYQSTKSEEIKGFNQKLSENPDYILPEGYKKLTVKKLVFEYNFQLESNSNLREQYKEVYEVLEEIFFQKFQFHILEPYSSTLVEATARPVLYQTSYMDYSIRERSLSSAMPKVSRIMRQTTGREREGEEEAPPQEGELGGELQDSRSPSHLVKIQNKFLKEKKDREEEKQKRVEDEEKKREQRDRQLKALLEKHREKQQEMEKQKEEKRLAETQKQEDEKKRKEKYEQDLKKRVEEYMKKKEIDKAREEQERRKKKEEDLRNFQKMKQDVERKKKLVEETKLKKKQEEQQKLEREKEEKKKLEEENRIKLEQKKERTRLMLEEYRQKKQREEEEKQKQKQSEPESQIKSKQKVKVPGLRKSKNSPPKAKEAKQAVNTEVKVEQLDNN